MDYIQNIKQSRLTIYDPISPADPYLYIPTEILQNILYDALVGQSLAGLPLRTRAKVVKSEVCKALGYPIPKSFSKTQPRFPGQNFDVYTQKSFNVQIWNEEVDGSRRYGFLRVNNDDIITSVRVISGNELAMYDRTGTLTRKYQATMNSYGRNICSRDDTISVHDWIVDSPNFTINNFPNSAPRKNQLLRISEVFHRLQPMVGKSISYLDAVQERNRGAELHSMICAHLGYSVYEDDGSYPDILNQLLEIKLQTSPTIDLGLHSPVDGEEIITVDGKSFYSQDIRYAIFDGTVVGERIVLNKLYLVTGEDFTIYFPLFKGINRKIQLPLPFDFFD